MNTIVINLLRIITFVIFIAIVPLLFLYESSTRLVWTILIPLLPVGLLIIGFSRWRDICPLAMISKISQRITLFEKRKVPQWFEKNFWYFQYFLLFVALALRLVVLNYDNYLLAIFFIVVMGSAFLSNLIFTGKSWCNFFCPVGTVEKIYTLSNAKNYDINSACFTCTTCKRNCPDIDLESSYWKEGANQQKSFVFYSFAGMILGFYLYFYFQSGSFSYYFSGEWTHLNLDIFSAGFFFAPFIPLVIAAPLTLVVFSSISFYLFKTIEHYLWKKRFFKDADYETAVHKVKTIASFVAFNIFYIFAGAPAYQHYPTAYGIFYFVVVGLSAIMFYKEIFREESFFIQERFALKIIKRWDSKKKISSNLKEIYYTYIHENKNKRDRLHMYKLSMTELLQEGILNERTLQAVEKLRVQLNITKQDHNRILKKIKLKDAALFDENVEKSAETRYQESTYKKLVQHVLDEHRDIDNHHLKALQKQFGVSDMLHKKIVTNLTDNGSIIQKEILSLLDDIHHYIQLLHSVERDGTREISFLKYSIKNEFTFASKELFSILFTLYKDQHLILKTLLNISKGKQMHSFSLEKSSLDFLDDAISTKMLQIYKSFISTNNLNSTNSNHTIIKELLDCNATQIAIAALLNTKAATHEYLTQDILDKFSSIDDINLQTLLYKLKYNTSTITTYEKMMYLNTIPIFRNLKFDDLLLLGKSAKVKQYTNKQHIIEQGHAGDALYALIRGRVNVEIDGKFIKILGHREYFGEISILGGINTRASIVAQEETIALSISKRKFKHFLYNNPKVSAKIMKTMIKKLL